MKKRLAEKILKYRERLRYSGPQIKMAEETLKDIERRRAKRELKKTEQKTEIEE